MSIHNFQTLFASFNVQFDFTDILLLSQFLPSYPLTLIHFPIYLLNFIFETAGYSLLWISPAEILHDTIETSYTK